jgi:hypothetical protein
MLLIVPAAFAQKAEVSVIKGTVTDSQTNEPLVAASVYFTGTTIGTTVRPDGHYEVFVLKPGNYELVVSMVGYETRKMKYNIEKEREYVCDLRMEPKSLNITTIEVEGVDQTEWKENLNLFLPKFLGTLGNPNECTIEKKEYIDFKWDGDALQASTSKPIVIVNEYLGYKVVCEIVKFIYNPTSRYYEYATNTLFYEMKPKDEKQKEKWAGHRGSAFFGSPEHFLWALKYGITEAQGYQLYPLNKDTDWDRNMPKEIDPNEFKSSGQYMDEPVYSFSGSIKVIYKSLDVSYITMMQPYFTIDSNGIADNHLPFICSGYWSKRGLANLLPHDYLPESIKKNFDMVSK